MARIDRYNEQYLDRAHGRYGVGRRDKKIAGVAAALGQAFNLDPTFIRIGFVATAVLVNIKLAIIGYIAAGIWLHMQKRGLRSDRRDDAGIAYRNPRTSVHAMRDMDVADRRMMAIDQQLSSARNDALAREIEALREDAQ